MSRKQLRTLWRNNIYKIKMKKNMVQHIKLKHCIILGVKY